MVVRRTRLATKLSIFVVGTHIAPQAHRCAATLPQTAQEHLLHEECTLVGDGLTLLRRANVDLIAVAVEDTGHEHRLMRLTVIGDGTIAVDEFQQVHITRPQGQRRGGVEVALDTHVMGRVHDVADADLLS